MGKTKAAQDGRRAPAERWMTAELNRRRIQGGLVATREQIEQAVGYALRETGWYDNDPVGIAVARVAVERLLEQLGIPVWEDVMLPCVTESGSPAGEELTSE